jgi:hypothetical protein
VQNDEASIEAAELNIEYAAIRSPIDGVTGIRQVDLGNLVQGRPWWSSHTHLPPCRKWTFGESARLRNEVSTCCL